MEFNSVKSAARNVTAGAAGVNALDSIFDTARATAPDFTKISTTARKARAQVSKAAMTADARVAMTGLSQVGQSKANDDTVKALKKDGHERLDNFRKAGILGAFRSAATGGILGIERRQAEKDKAERIAREEQHLRNIESIYAERDNGPQQPKFEPTPFRDPPEPTAVAPTLERPGQQNSSGEQMSFTPPANMNLSKGFTNISSLTDDDWKMLAFGVSGEAERGTDDEFGVAGVILNRLANQSSGGHKATNISEVIHAPWQFVAVTGHPGKHGPTAYHDAALVQRLKNNPQKLQQALAKLNGITQFRGTELYHNMKPGDIKFSSRGNFYF